jgi:hypothetical protein
MARAALAALTLLALAACSNMSPTPAEPPRGRGDSDVPVTDLPSAKSSFFGPRARVPELELVLPPAPRDEDLEVIKLFNESKNTVALDRKALVVGKDDVVRYTLVVTSPRGVRNVSYEGIRCDPNEWKLYAIGRTDGTWSTVPDPQWKEVENRDYNDIHYTLAKEYYCGLNGAPLPSGEAILARIRFDRSKRDQIRGQ